MPLIDIPDPLPPAIAPDREVIEFLIERHLEEFGDNSLVARSWHWILHGGGRAPISHTDWSHFDGDGPPSAATLAAESTASEPPLHPTTPGTSSTGPGSSAGYAPPSPKTNSHCDFTPGMLRAYPPSAKKAQSPPPCASSGTPDSPAVPQVTAIREDSTLLPARKVPCRTRDHQMVQGCVVEDLAELMMAEATKTCRLQDRLRDADEGREGGCPVQPNIAKSRFRL